MSESLNVGTDGRWLESHPIGSPRAFGSGELKCQTEGNKIVRERGN